MNFRSGKHFFSILLNFWIGVKTFGINKWIDIICYSRIITVFSVVESNIFWILAISVKIKLLYIYIYIYIYFRMGGGTDGAGGDRRTERHETDGRTEGRTDRRTDGRTETDGRVHYFGSENHGRIQYFRCWKPCKCSLFSNLKALEVCTIFGSDNHWSVY